jgi:(E)-4-hydroxy-3-methylbut-2-enyl-diphosphate synthase
LLVARLAQEGPDWNYPIHLGVTEAGEGEDGRIKSAIGIGSLLCDGLGDTIRVSLTEDSPREIEVCRDLLAQIPLLTRKAASPSTLQPFDPSTPSRWPFDPFSFQRRSAPEIDLGLDGLKCGGEQTVRVVVTRGVWEKVAPKIAPKADVKPEAVYEDLNILELDPTQEIRLEQINCDTQLVTVKDGVELPAIAAFRLLALAEATGPLQPDPAQGLSGIQQPRSVGTKDALLRASVVIGSLLADGIGDAILIRGEAGAGQACGLPTIFFRRRAAVPSKPITSRARAAAGRCSTCKPSPRASRRARNISKA